MKSLKSKFIVPSMIILIALVLIQNFFSLANIRNFSGTLTDERLETAMVSTNAYLSGLQERSRLASLAAASSAVVVDSTRGWNAGMNQDNIRVELFEYLTSVKASLGIDEVILTDQSGTVILRTAAPNTFGDSLAGDAVVSAALGGASTSSFYSTNAVPLSLVFHTPIVHAGQNIGTLSSGMVMSSNSFVDSFANALNAEITVFDASGLRVATTLLDASYNREIGIYAPAEVIQDVIAGGRRHSTTDLSLQGRPFSAYYFPLHGADGSIVGMFFAGFSNEAGVAAESNMLIVMLAVIVIGTAIAAAIMYINTTRIVAPIKKLVRLVSDVSAGRLETNISQKDLTKDEIGALTVDVISLVNVIRDMVDDLSHIQDEYNVKGNMNHRVDADRYQNAFRELVISINTILDEEVANIRNVSDILGSIGGGNFNVTVTDLPGDFIMQSNSIRNVLAKLTAVNTEIANIVEAAAEKGDLNYRIDTSQFSGSWKEIMNGLTDICKAVDIPLKVLALSVKELKEGNFDLDAVDRNIKATGISPNATDYNGVFREIIAGFDSAMQSTSSYIGEIEKVLADMSKGDLRTSISRDFVGAFDLIKKSVNNISATLNKTMSEINSASNQVLAGAKQISMSANDLANGAQSQASSIQELNASIDLINQQTKQNAENSMGANDLSAKSTTNAREGNESMKQMLSAMEQIKEASNNISKIIKSIQDIAFQTNLLALNAAVEAARAGEHGKGFAVVAEEVRNLAARSQAAAADTTTLIQESINRVESGSDIATSTSASLDVIVKGATEISEIINSITIASQEQSDAISQVSIGLHQISQVVQSNSATSEETAAASEELNSQAELLQQLVAYFKI